MFIRGVLFREEVQGFTLQRDRRSARRAAARDWYDRQSALCADSRSRADASSSRSRASAETAALRSPAAISERPGQPLIPSEARYLRSIDGCSPLIQRETFHFATDVPTSQNCRVKNRTNVATPLAKSRRPSFISV